MPNTLSDLIRSVRFTGLSNALNALSYSVYRDHLNRRYYSSDNTQTHPQGPGNQIAYQQIPAGGEFEFERAKLEVRFLKPTIVRISWVPGVAPIPYALAAMNWPEVTPVTSQTSQGSTCLESALKVQIDSQGCIEFFAAGELLRKDLPPTRAGNQWRAESILTPEEVLLGLGEHSGPLNLRERSHSLWNQDAGGSYIPGSDPLYMPLPVYLGINAHGAYLVFHENYHRGQIDFSNDQRMNVSFEKGMLRYYVFTGSLKEIFTHFSELTGRAPLPPRWSLGFHQSRWGYTSQEEVVAVLQGFVDHELPLSAIHLDIDYMQGYRVFTVDSDRFPDLKELSNTLADHDVRLVTILDPGVKIDSAYDIYNDGVSQHTFCKTPDGKLVRGLVWPGWSVFPDFTNSAARAWWGKHYQRLISLGVDGFWHDMNEPTSFTAWGDMDLPLATQHEMDGQKGDHSSGHNVYGLEMNRAGYEAQKKVAPNRRPWLLSRSGWVGQQRYAWSWTGDTDSSWDSLHMTIISAISLNLSGVPYVGPDIGGFSGNPSPELFLRWLQFACFTPFFRSHAAKGTRPREPWQFPPPYLEMIRSTLKLRQQLIPYLYTLAWEHTKDGAPFIRPLFWDSLSEQNLWIVDDAFLLGEHVLVAPIILPGSISREVYLPPGTWSDFISGKPHVGPDTRTIETGLDRIPVLIKAGSLLPLAREEALELRIFPGNGSQMLYSDAGDGFGDSRLDTFIQSYTDEHVAITWSDSGSYEFPYSQVVLTAPGFRIIEAMIDGQILHPTGGKVFTPKFKQAKLHLQWNAS